MTDMEKLHLNLQNHTSALLIIALLVDNILDRQQYMLNQYGDPKADFVITDRQLLGTLTAQLKQMKVRGD
jgi:hypothetical protein